MEKKKDLILSLGALKNHPAIAKLAKVAEIEIEPKLEIHTSYNCSEAETAALCEVNMNMEYQPILDFMNKLVEVADRTIEREEKAAYARQQQRIAAEARNRKEELRLQSELRMKEEAHRHELRMKELEMEMKLVEARNASK